MQTWTALISPLDKEGKFDKKTFEILLKQQEAANNGVLLLGSTGEGLAFNLEEKKNLVQAACALNLKIPLLLGVGGFNLEETKAWVEWGNGLPIHGFLLVTPIYAKPGTQGQIQWFRSLLGASKKPCMLYNTERAACPLSFDAVKALSTHPHLWAIKEASGDLETFRRYGQSAPLAELYSGCDHLMAELAQVGATGIVSVMSNVWPQESNAYVSDCLKKRHKKTPEEWLEKARITNQCNPVAVKLLLHNRGTLPYPTVRPPLSTEDVDL